MFYVYILKSFKNRSIYIGLTSRNPRIRLMEHNNGYSNFTRMNIPWFLVYYEELLCKKCAQKRERFLKSGIGRRFVKVIVKNF